MHLLTHLFAVFLRIMGKGVQHWTADPEKAIHGQGSVTLVMPRVLALFGLGLILLSAYALYRLMPFENTPLSGTIILVMICLAIAVPGVLALLEVRNHRVIIMGETCYVTNMRGRTHVFSWGQVQHVRPGSTSSLIRIELNDGRRIKVSPFLLGSSVLTTALVDAMDTAHDVGDRSLTH